MVQASTGHLALRGARLAGALDGFGQFVGGNGSGSARRRWTRVPAAVPLGFGLGQLVGGFGFRLGSPASAAGWLRVPAVPLGSGSARWAAFRLAAVPLGFEVRRLVDVAGLHPGSWSDRLRGGVMPETRRRYDPELRAGAVRIATETRRSAAAESQRSCRGLFHWRDQYGGKSARADWIDWRFTDGGVSAG